MPKPPKAAVIIPARWESTRFPGKPLHVIAGKPLIQHVWERCRKARQIDRVVVATDDKRIADAAKGFGAEVVMTSKRHRSGTDRVAEAAAKLHGITHVINVQGDEPVIDPKLVTQLARALIADKSISMITAANVMHEAQEALNPNVVKVVLNRSSDALYFSRSPLPYARVPGVLPSLRHQGIYGYTNKFLLEFVRMKPGLLERAEQLEQLRALENGVSIRVVVTKHVSLGVDSPEDVAPVENILRSGVSSS